MGQRHIFIFLCFICLQTLSAQGLEDELERLYRIDLLPEYFENSPEQQFSSYDRTGGNDDGFNGTYSFIRMEGEDQVIAEMQGPGVINRIWTPTPSEDTIAFYFDGEEYPRINMPFMDLFRGDCYPFLRPLCAHEVGGYYCYLPIPYRESCRVVYQGRMLFYQMQYRSYPDIGRVSSYPAVWNEHEKETLQKVLNLWNAFGSNFLHTLYDRIKTEIRTVHLRPGESMSFFNLNQGGRIIGFEVDGLTNLEKQKNNLVLKIRWDDQDHYAVHAPLKDFFGSYFGEMGMRSLLMGNSGNTSYCYLPMPFARSAHMELACLGQSDSSTMDNELTFRIYYTPVPKNDHEGRFFAYWKREINPASGQPYVILPEFRGKGHYVGTVLSCQGLMTGSTGYFEGDDQATIDGMLRIHGTGSEDYFNGGWYLTPDRWDMAHSLPSHGCLGYDYAMSRTGGYRFYFTDKLSFSNDFKLTIEHGHEGNRFPVDDRSVAFYYADTGLIQDPPDLDIVSYPVPDTLKFQGYLLQIQSFRNGKLINGEIIGRNRVLTMEPSGDQSMLVKINLDFPEDGQYKLYASYYRTPLSGEIRFMQRQVPLTGWKDISAVEQEYTDREYVGGLQVLNGECTLTIHIRGKSYSRFQLHELILVKI